MRALVLSTLMGVALWSWLAVTPAQAHPPRYGYGGYNSSYYQPRAGYSYSDYGHRFNSGSYYSPYSQGYYGSGYHGGYSPSYYGSGYGSTYYNQVNYGSGYHAPRYYGGHSYYCR